MALALALLLIATVIVAPPVPADPVAPEPAHDSCNADPVATALAQSGAIAYTEDPDAGTWPTWWQGPADIDVPPPPQVASQVTLDELQELHGYQDNRTAAQRFKAVLVDGDGVAGLFWSQKTLQVIEILGLRNGVTPPRMAFLMGLMETAIQDALVVSWHYKYCYLRPAPYHLDPTLQTLVEERPVPSYPSEHAAAAGVASFLLDQFFPDKNTAEGTTAEILALALESRLVAGANYRTDIDAGFAIGEAVAAYALETYSGSALHDRWDRRDRPDPLTVPCAWQETPPLWNDPIEPLFGQVPPLLMSSGDLFRAPPPPACDGETYLAEMQAVHAASLSLDADDKELADAWDLGVLTILASGHALDMALDATTTRGLTAMHHQRVVAHTMGAVADGGIACWDSKYAYWMERPYTAIRRTIEASWEPYIDTPASAGHVSGHACFIAAATHVLASFFATDADLFALERAELAEARVLGGVSTPAEVERGLAIGASVADLFAARAAADGIGTYG